MEQPILTLLDFGNLFQVECDVSGIAIGAILSQEGNPIAYFSDNLNDTKQKYSSYDKQFYSFVHSFKK